MQDTERDIASSLPATRQGDMAQGDRPAPARGTWAEAKNPLNAKAGLIQRCLQFLMRCFGSGKALPPKELNAAQRAAALRAVQTTPPVTFVGQTTSTLVTPMGAYAGKPLEQALRKRAEQQFTAMDITQTTMH